MKHLKFTLSGLFIFSSIAVWASGPDLHSATNAILQDDTALQSFGTSPTDLAQYGIETVWYKRLQYTAKMGFNFTSNGFTSMQTPNFLSNPAFGFVFGGAVSLPFDQYYCGLRLELLYSQDVFSTESSVDGMPTLYINRLTSLDIPLILQIKPVKDVGLALLVGGDYNILLGNSYTYAEISSNQTLNTTAHSALGYLFGIEYTLYEITGGLRFTGGVPDNSNSPNPKALVGQFTLGYTIQYQ